MAAYSSVIRGAAEVYSVDHVQERLDAAESIGAIPINYDEADPVEQIQSMRGGDGTDKVLMLLDTKLRSQDHPLREESRTSSLTLFSTNSFRSLIRRALLGYPVCTYHRTQVE